MPGATPKITRFVDGVACRPAAGLIQAMSSPMVVTAVKPAGGNQHREVGLPQALGNAAATLYFLFFRGHAQISMLASHASSYPC
jgi:hypothetical protein